MTTWLDTTAAASYLGGDKSVHEVRRKAFDQSGGKRCPAGLIPGYKFGREWRFSTEELDAHIKGIEPGPRRITTGRRRSA